MIHAHNGPAHTNTQPQLLRTDSRARVLCTLVVDAVEREPRELRPLPDVGRRSVAREQHAAAATQAAGALEC